MLGGSERGEKSTSLPSRASWPNEMGSSETAEAGWRTVSKRSQLVSLSSLLLPIQSNQTLTLFCFFRLQCNSSSLNSRGGREEGRNASSRVLFLLSFLACSRFVPCFFARLRFYTVFLAFSIFSCIPYHFFASRFQLFFSLPLLQSASLGHDRDFKPVLPFLPPTNTPSACPCPPRHHHGGPPPPLPAQHRPSTSDQLSSIQLGLPAVGERLWEWKSLELSQRTTKTSSIIMSFGTRRRKRGGSMGGGWLLLCESYAS